MSEIKLKVLYFASLGENLGLQEETLKLTQSLETVEGLKAHLASRGGKWSALADDTSLRCAVDQAIAQDHTPLKNAVEIAFFPPVTGG